MSESQEPLARERFWVRVWAHKLARMLKLPLPRGGCYEASHLHTLEYVLNHHEQAHERLKRAFHVRR